MSLTTAETATLLENPIDVLESIATSQNWPFDRSAEDELSLTVTGSWCDYDLSFTWRDDLNGLHLACAFDLKIKGGKLNDVHDLLARINEQMWLGHFDIWKDEGVVLFRHGLLLGTGDASPEQCEMLLSLAIEACERYYPAFQFVLWAGQSAEDAMAACMFETHGSA